MCAFLRKTNGTSMFFSMMRMIFILGFTKKYLQEKKLGPIKDAFHALRIRCTSRSQKEIQRDYEGELYTQDIAPLGLLVFLAHRDR